MTNIKNMDKVTLYDESGEPVDFDVIMRLEAEGNDYFIVAESDLEDEEELEALALRLDVDENGEEILVTLEDEDEIRIVSETFEMLYAEEE